MNNLYLHKYCYRHFSYFECSLLNLTSETLPIINDTVTFLSCLHTVMAVALLINVLK